MEKWLIKHQLILIITAIALGVIGGISFFAWLIHSNNNAVDSERYTPTQKYALLDLGSTNCSPCIKLQPVMAELREKYGDKIDIAFYDIVGTQEGAAMANGYNVSIMPTLLFINEYGYEIKRVVGFHTTEQIEQIFSELRWIE